MLYTDAMEVRATLTDAQQAIYNYIVSYIREHRYSPTFVEIKDHFNYQSDTSAVSHIHKLIDKGYITKDSKPGKTSARTIKLVDDIIGNYTIDGKFLHEGLKRLRERGYKLDTNTAVEFLRELSVNII